MHRQLSAVVLQRSLGDLERHVVCTESIAPAQIADLIANRLDDLLTVLARRE